LRLSFTAVDSFGVKTVADRHRHIAYHNSATNSVGAFGGQIEELEKKLLYKEAELRKSQGQNEELKAITKTKEDEIASLNKQLERSKVALQEISEELNCNYCEVFCCV